MQDVNKFSLLSWLSWLSINGNNIIGESANILKFSPMKNNTKNSKQLTPFPSLREERACSGFPEGGAHRVTG